MRVKITRSVIGVFALTALLGADTLYLKEGDTVRGKFISGDSREIRFQPEGSDQAMTYTFDKVSSVAFGPAAKPAGITPRTGTRSRNASRMVVPEGTTITVSMIDPINSDSTNAGESFRGSLEDAIVVDGKTVAPKGADVTVKVVKVDEAGRLAGKEQVAIELSEILIGEKRYVAQSSHAIVSAKSRGDENLKVVGGTAVVGAIIGAIAGGGKGAAIGAASGAGAGAAVQAIRGQRVQIPAESRLDFNLSQPLYID